MAAENATETRENTGLQDAENNDILQRLWRSFNPSRNFRQCEMPTLTFKEFNEEFNFKRVTDMSPEKYRGFVDRFQKSYDLTVKDKRKLLDALDCGENDEKFQTFKFNDGKGNIHHGRVATLKKDGKMDFAYAVYKITFELAEDESNDWVYKWLLYVIPIGWKYKAEMLTQEQKDGFSEWCEWKLHRRVAQEC